MELNEQYILSAFYEIWVAQGRKTLSILRYTNTGSTPHKGIAGTNTLVAGLASLPCVSFNYSLKILKTGRGEIKDRIKKFVFQSPVEIVASDKISFDSLTWEVMSIDGYSSTSGMAYVVCRRTN